MKKILLILCLIPFLGYSQVSYKIKADSTILSNIGSGKNELVIRNATSDVTGGVLTNLGNGVTAFVISGGDSQTLSISGDTLSISNGNSVVLPVFVQVDSAVINSYTVLNSQNAPPGSPVTGDTYLVGTSPSGAWVGHAKDIAEWNGSSWGFIDAVQGDFLYNTTNALTYIFRSGNWVQTTALPALNNGNNISSGLTIGTNNLKALNFETNNVNRGRFDSTGRFYVYNIPTASDTFLATVNSLGVINKIGKNSIVDTFVLSTKGNVTGLLLSKQNNLVSGTNIKTVNSTSLLGSGNITTPDAQTLSTTYSSDSIALSISGGNTIKFAYAVDSVGLNGAGDSIIVYKYGIRKPYKNGSSGGGGGSLSSLTAASATNSIDNTNYKQRWNWSTLAGDTGLYVFSNSTAAASNLQTPLVVSNFGANSNGYQTTYGAKISNTKTGTSAINYGLYAKASGGGSNYAIGADGDVFVLTGFGYKFQSGGSITDGGALQITAGTNRAIFLTPTKAEGVDIITSANYISHNFYEVSGTDAGIIMGGRYNAGTYEPFNTTAIVQLQRQSGKLNFIAATGLAGPYTPSSYTIMTMQGGASGAAGNVGIGTTSPSASAKLEVSSTTMGFLTARWTNAQMAAISSPATGLSGYNTDAQMNLTYNGSNYKSSGIVSGSYSSTGTATTTFTVTFGGTQPNTTYKVNVTPTSSLTAALFYITNKTTTTFDVTYLSGLTGTVTFDYIVSQ